MSKERAVLEFYDLFNLLHECYVKFHEWEVLAPDDCERRESAYEAKGRRTGAICRLMKTIEGLGYDNFAEAHMSLFASRISDSPLPSGRLPHCDIDDCVDVGDGVDCDDVRKRFQAGGHIDA